MRLITRQSIANGVASRWASQYERYGWREDKLGILTQLRALGTTPCPDEVDTIFGNKSWTRTECHECGAIGVDVVQLEQEPDYAAGVCESCLVEALMYFNGSG